MRRVTRRFLSSTAVRVQGVLAVSVISWLPRGSTVVGALAPIFSSICTAPVTSHERVVLPPSSSLAAAGLAAKLMIEASLSS